MYIAKQSVGKFATGEEVIGLTDARAKELLAHGAIELIEDKPKAKAEPKADKPKSTAKKSNTEGE